MLGNSQHSQLPLLVKEGLMTSLPKYFFTLAGKSSLILLFGLLDLNRLISFDPIVHESFCFVLFFKLYFIPSLFNL